MILICVSGINTDDAFHTYHFAAEVLAGTTRQQVAGKVLTCFTVSTWEPESRKMLLEIDCDPCIEDLERRRAIAQVLLEGFPFADGYRMIVIFKFGNGNEEWIMTPLGVSNAIPMS